MAPLRNLLLTFLTFAYVTCDSFSNSFSSMAQQPHTAGPGTPREPYYEVYTSPGALMAGGKPPALNIHDWNNGAKYWNAHGAGPICGLYVVNSWSPSLRGPAFVVNAGTGHFEVLGSISQTKGHDEVANPVINREQLGGAFMRIGLMPSSRWDAAVQVAQGVDVGKRAKPRWPYCKAAGRRLASKWLAHRVMYMSPNVKGAMGAGIGAGGALVGWRALREWQKKEAREEARRAGERIVQGPRPGAPAAAAAIEMSAVRLAEQGTSHGAAGKVAAEKVATDQAAPGKVGSFKMTLAEAEAEAKHGGKAKIEQID